MSALEIVAEAKEVGVSLHVEGDSIRVEPRSALSHELRARIIAEKPAILAVLRAQGARHWRFCMAPDGAVPFEERTLPQATRANACRLWPIAREEPLPAVAHALGLADEIQHRDLLALVERVALAYHAPLDETAEMQRIALADPAAAWECFTRTAALETLQ